MFEDIMCLMAGFLTSYLILRAVRSFRGGVGVVFLFLGQVWAQAGSVTIYNDSGVTITYKWAVYITSNSNWAYGGFHTVLAGESYYATTTAGDTGYYYAEEGIHGENGSWAGYNAASGNKLTTTDAGTYSFHWGSSTTYAKVCGSGWTNTLSCCVSVELMATNNGSGMFFNATSRNICPGDYMPSWCLTNMLGTDVNGSGIPFSVTLSRSGCQEDDFIPKVLFSGDSGNLTGAMGPGGGPVPTEEGPAPVAPINTNRTSDQVLNDDLRQLIKVVSKEVKQDKQIELLNDAVDLLDLATMRQDDQLDQQDLHHEELMDQTKRIQTNTSEIAFNTAPVTTNTVSNGMSYVWGTLGSLTNSSNWSASMLGRTLTNGAGYWGTGSATEPGSDPMAVTVGAVGGHTYSMSFSLARQGHQLYLTMLQAAPWVRQWLAWGVTLTLWWLCVARIDEAVTQTNKGSIVAGKGGGGTAATYSVRLLTGLLTALAITSIMATLPTAAVAWLSTHGVTNPMGATGFMESLAGAGSAHLVAIFQEYYNLLFVFVPLDVIFTAITSWILFFFSVQFWFGLVCTGLRVIGMAIPCLVFGVFCCQVEAAQVRFENFAGEQVVVSNGAAVVTFPVGVCDKVVLGPGNWIAGTNGFTVDAGGYEVVRAWGDTNAVGELFFTQAKGYSGYEWFMWGMNSGFLIFGTTWAISCARSGILLRVRE